MTLSRQIALAGSLAVWAAAPVLGSSYNPVPNWKYTPSYNPGLQQMNDDQLNQDIKDNFTTNYEVRDFSWAVYTSTKNGVVTLTGYVPTDILKSRFGTLARSVNGVKQVVNNIQVKSSPTTEDTPPPNPMPAPPQQ